MKFLGRRMSFNGIKVHFRVTNREKKIQENFQHFRQFLYADSYGFQFKQFQIDDISTVSTMPFLNFIFKDNQGKKVSL